jgi:small-conductance mechanosensitive channel
VDTATVVEELKTLLGLQGQQTGTLLVKAIQILVVILVTAWLAHWVSASARRAAKTGRIRAEIAALASRAAALGICALGVTLILAILGASWTAIAALLGAATFGISLALQDVGRSFVNGVYILVERPFRIGDRIRVGETEGRVEDVGIRLTILRSDSGERIIVPNTVIFSSTLENLSVGNVDRQVFRMTGVNGAPPDIEQAVIDTLRGASHLSHKQPVIAIAEASPEGTTVEVSVEHDLGQRVDAVVIDRLRARFPEATVSSTVAGAS